MQIERLTTLDRIMLWASRRWPQDIGALLILDGAPLFDRAGDLRIELLRRAIASRLHLVPRYRQLITVPRRGLGGPLWVDAPTFDITRHVRELRLEPPAGEAELLAAVEDLVHQRLDPSRPLWEMWFLTGLSGARVALFVRSHHAIADGMAALATMTRFLDPSPDTADASPPPWQPQPPPSTRDLLTDAITRQTKAIGHWLAPLVRPLAAVRGFRAAWPAIREILAEEPATATSLDRMVGAHRSLAVVRTDLAMARAIGRRHDATVNDVLLAAIAAGLRALLRERGEPVDETTIRIYVPVSMRRRLRGRQEGNLIAQMAVPLRMGEADPVHRLEDIAAETRQRKTRARTSLANLIIGGAIGRRLMLLAVMRQRVNATSASIPGPTKPLYLAGARVLEVVALPPLIANEPVAVGALSYAGALTIGIVADRDALPDLDVFSAAVGRELELLGASQPERTVRVAAPTS